MRPYKQVDVFTSSKYNGNPLAVFFDADDLSEQEMQKMSNWTNLSETTFVCKPTDPKADYRVKIFTTLSQLPFAGHPTVGTCFALLELGLIKPNAQGKIYQQCAGGLVELSIDNYDANDLSNVLITFKLPYYKFSPITVPTSEVETILGVGKGAIISTPILVEDGPKWATFEIVDGETVKNAKPDFAAFAKVCLENDWDGIGIFGKYLTSPGYELRNFATDVDEDPACGSGAGAVGAFLAAHAKRLDINEISLTQGCNVNRDARIKVSIQRTSVSSPSIFVSGSAVTCINGTY